MKENMKMENRGKAPIEQTPVEQAPAPAEKAPAKKAPIEQTPVEQAPAPAEKAPAKKAPIEQTPASAEQVPVEDISEKQNERKAKLESCAKDIDGLVKKYNGLLQGNDFEGAMKINNKIWEVIGDYNKTAKDIMFENLRVAPDPMLAAITTLDYTIIGVRDKVDKDSPLSIPVREVIFKEKEIDLYKLHQYCEGGIGHDKNWLYIAEQFCLQMTAAAAKDLGLDPQEVNDSFAMSNIAREISLGKDPCSNTQLLRSLNKVIDAMIGTEHGSAISRDRKFIEKCFTRKSRKALTIATANHRQMRRILAEVCNRIVTGKEYSLDYTKIKEKNA